MTEENPQELEITVEFRDEPEAASTLVNNELILTNMPTKFLIKNTADTTAAHQALLTKIAEINHEGLIISDAKVIPQYVNIDAPATCVWYGEVEYISIEEAEQNAATTKPLKAGEISWTVRGVADTQKITHAISTRVVYDIFGNVVQNDPYKKAINVTPKKILGCKIKLSHWVLTVTKCYAKGSSNVVPSLEALFDHVNTNALSITDSQTGQVFTAQPGEALFCNPSVTRSDNKNTFLVQYQLDIIRNSTGLNVFGVTVPNKRGHDYLWASFDTSEIPPEMIADVYSGNSKQKKAAHVLINQVYPEKQFNI